MLGLWEQLVDIGRGDWARDQTFFRPFIKPAPNLNQGARSLNQQGFGLAAATRVGQKDGYNYLFRRHFILPELVGRDKKLMEVGAVVRVALFLTVALWLCILRYDGLLAMMAQWHDSTVAS